MAWRARAVIVGVILTFMVMLVPGPAASAATAQPTSADIIAGSTVPVATFSSRWQFIAALDVGGTVCGGSVIDSRTIITAAHCVSDGAVSVGADRITAFVGSEIWGTGAALKAERVVVHPDYQAGPEFVNDVALIWLSSATDVQPISIVGADQAALWGNGAGLAIGADGPWVAGWGLTTEGDSGSLVDNLREVAVPIASDVACSDPNSPGYGPGTPLSVKFCAGSPTVNGGTGADTCQGDSGGPLLVGDGSGGYRLAGLTSSGIGCGSSNYGLYSKLSAFLPWINEHSYGGSSSVAPVSGLAVARFLTSLTATWTLPDAPPDSVEVRISGPGVSRVVTLSGSSTSTTFSGLDPGVSYSVSVLTVLGPDTAAAPPWSGTTLRDTAAPSRPGRVVMTAKRRRSVTLTWAPATDNHRVGSYRVYRRVATGWKLLGSTTTRSMTLRGLARGKRYLIAVRGVDASGNAGPLSSGRFVQTS